MGKHEAVLTQTINAKPAEVWKEVSDVARFVDWFPHAKSGRLLGAKKPGKGVHRVIALDNGGKTIESEQEITAFEPDKRFAWHHLKDTVDGKPFTMIEESEMSFELRPAGGSTEVVLTARWEVGGLTGRLLAPKIRKVVTDVATQALGNLKKAVEG